MITTLTIINIILALFLIYNLIKIHNKFNDSINSNIESEKEKQELLKENEKLKEELEIIDHNINVFNKNLYYESRKKIFFEDLYKNFGKKRIDLKSLTPFLKQLEESINFFVDNLNKKNQKLTILSDYLIYVNKILLSLEGKFGINKEDLKGLNTKKVFVENKILDFIKKRLEIGNNKIQLLEKSLDHKNKTIQRKSQKLLYYKRRAKKFLGKCKHNLSIENFLETLAGVNKKQKKNLQKK